MKHKLLSLIFVLTCFIGAAFAQDRQVSGKVTSATDGAPLSGVSVALVGTGVAAQSDANGDYTITVEGSNAVLNFSFVGFTSTRVQVGTQTSINVQLVEDEMSLDEVVVVGYGSTTKEAFTGSA